MRIKQLSWMLVICWQFINAFFANQEHVAIAY